MLAAAALRCIGGQMQGRLLFEDDGQIERARGMGITDPHRKYESAEMARGDVMFAATGVTTGPMLRGVRRFGTGADHPLHRHAQPSPARCATWRRTTISRPRPGNRQA